MLLISHHLINITFHFHVVVFRLYCATILMSYRYNKIYELDIVERHCGDFLSHALHAGCVTVAVAACVTA